MPSVPPVVRTERLELRAWSEDDAAELRAVIDANDAHLRPWLPTMREEPRTLDETRERVVRFAREFEERSHLRWSVRDPDGGALVGEVLLIDRGDASYRELGYWFVAAVGGRGYATEASRAAVRVAFEVLGCERVTVRCDERNAPSNMVAARLGARRVGVEVVDEGAGPERLVLWELAAPARA